MNKYRQYVHLLKQKADFVAFTKDNSFHHSYYFNEMVQYNHLLDDFYDMVIMNDEFYYKTHDDYLQLYITSDELVREYSSYITRSLEKEVFNND